MRLLFERGSCSQTESYFIGATPIKVNCSSNTANIIDHLIDGDFTTMAQCKDDVVKPIMKIDLAEPKEIQTVVIFNRHANNWY